MQKKPLTDSECNGTSAFHRFNHARDNTSTTTSKSQSRRTIEFGECFFDVQSIPVNDLITSTTEAVGKVVSSALILFFSVQELAEELRKFRIRCSNKK